MIAREISMDDESHTYLLVLLLCAVVWLFSIRTEEGFLLNALKGTINIATNVTRRTGTLLKNNYNMVKGKFVKPPTTATGAGPLAKVSNTGKGTNALGKGAGSGDGIADAAKPGMFAGRGADIGMAAISSLGMLPIFFMLGGGGGGGGGGDGMSGDDTKSPEVAQQQKQQMTVSALSCLCCCCLCFSMMMLMMVAVM